MDLADKSKLIEYLKSHGLWAKHGLGQNFLVDREALDKIIQAAELKKDDFVIEVGPGLGVLTQELVKKAGKVVAVEIDDKLAGLLYDRMTKSEFLTRLPDGQVPNKMTNDQILENQKIVNLGIGHFVRNLKFGFRNFTSELQIVQSDILKLNMPKIFAERSYKVVANIPYYITSKIIELFLTQENKPELIVLLVQKEVAERITAKPGQMSILALSVQAYGEPEIIGIVPKESFFPSPEVDSAILKIRITNKELGIRDERELFRLIHIGFASKRKTLVNNLSAGLHLDKQQASGIIQSIGLNENVRAQELSLEQWKALAQGIMNQEL